MVFSPWFISMLHIFLLCDKLLMLNKILLPFRSYTLQNYIYISYSVILVLVYICTDMKYAYVYLFIFCNVCSNHRELFNTLPTDHGFNQLQVYFAWQLIEIAIGIYNQFSDKTKGNALEINIISFHLFNTYIIICNSSEKDLSSLNEEIILWFQPYNSSCF